MGLDVLDDRAMVTHYRNFRSRFHFGRNWYKSLTSQVVSPLFSVQLNELADSMSEAALAEGEILQRIMITAFPELSRYPYDKPDKGFSDKLFIKSLTTQIEN